MSRAEGDMNMAKCAIADELGFDFKREDGSAVDRREATQLVIDQRLRGSVAAVNCQLGISPGISDDGNKHIDN